MTAADSWPIIDAMSDRGLHYIEDDLSETWIEDWAGAGIAQIEDLLGKHAAFLRYLETTDTSRRFSGAAAIRTRSVKLQLPRPRACRAIRSTRR